MIRLAGSDPEFSVGGMMLFRPGEEMRRTVVTCFLQQGEVTVVVGLL